MIIGLIWPTGQQAVEGVDFIGNISDNHYHFVPEDRETSFGTLQNVKSFRVYFDGQEKDLFRTFFGTLGITRMLGDSTSVSLLASAFSTKEQERYDLQGQYWLTQTETSENLGVGTYFQHARNYLDADVQSVKLMARHMTKHHKIEGGVTFKFEHITEKSVEYEMRDSSGYSIPHTGKDLYMIYSLRANNTLNANRIEAYLQDTYRFSGHEGGTLYTLNYGLRLAHWNFNKETLLSPRASLSIIPAFNQNLTFRFASGLYYQAPFYKELRDTTTVNGVTYANLNEKAKSQRSIHFIVGADYGSCSTTNPSSSRLRPTYRQSQSRPLQRQQREGGLLPGDTKANGHASGIDLKLFW